MRNQNRMDEFEGRILDHQALLNGSIVLAVNLNARRSLASMSSSIAFPLPVGQYMNGEPTDGAWQFPCAKGKGKREFRHDGETRQSPGTVFQTNVPAR